MNRLKSLSVIIFVFLVFVFCFSRTAYSQQIEFLKVDKQRVIVLTDITNEPDDQESMVRFLVYANEYDIEGLIATTSTWLRDKVRPDKIRYLVEAYDRVRENLVKHAPGYPTGDYLLGLVKSHLPVYGMAGVGEGKSTEGSRLIIEVVDKPDPRPVWISVWGGASCLAQALWEVKQSRTPEEVEKFVKKLRVYTISDQDDSGRWMRLQFPDLFYIVSPSDQRGGEYHKATWTGISGDRYYRNGPMHKFELVDNPWLRENIIQNHGPLGALYLEAKYIMEGDTPSFIGLINNGLGSAISPAYGGWGGRYQLYQTYAEIRPIWTNTRNSRDEVSAENGCTSTSDQATIWRWRESYQHDFAARMDWCVADRYEKANHNPVVVINGDESKDVMKVTVKSGETITLNAAGTHDPDENKFSYNWWLYHEAGSYTGSIDLEKKTAEEIRFVAPQVTKPADAHIICEVRDSGTPNLFGYRRIIISISGP